MKLKLLAYGIAKDIMGGRTHEMDMNASNIADLRRELGLKYPDFAKLNSLAFAVKEEYRDELFKLGEGDEVVIIPPVSGG